VVRFLLDHLRELGDTEAERSLMKLPGLSWKGARCVMLYGLMRDVFPVDSNTLRILKRTGVVRADAVYRRRELHDAIQALVQTPRRRLLHVNLVVHGQQTCLPLVPKCANCRLSELCPQRGVTRSAVRSMRRRAGLEGCGQSPKPTK
jgi:endonuclease III